MLNKQLDMNDMQEVDDVISVMNELDHTFFANSLTCRRWEYGWLLHHLLKFLVVNENIKWLDVGSGDSIVPFFVAEKGFESYVVEVDDSFKNRFINNKFSLPINFNIITNNVLPFDSNFFDVVTSVSVLEHIVGDGDIASVVECARVLKPGGVFALTTDLAAIANFSGNLRAGDLHWHWYDLPAFQSRIINTAKRYGLQIIDNDNYILDFSRTLPDHWCKEVNIVSLFMRKL